MSDTIKLYQQGNITAHETSATIQTDPFRALLSPYKKLSFPSSNLIVLQARSVSFAANTLGQTTHIYSSTLYADMISLANYFADWGCSYQTQEGAIHTMTITAPWDTISSEDWFISRFASDQWEIIPQQAEKSILSTGYLKDPYASPAGTGNYTILPLQLQAAVLVATKNGGTTLNLTGSSLTATQKTQFAPFVPAANAILSFKTIGIDSIPQFTQTLKRTAVIDRNNTNGAFLEAADLSRNAINAQGTINYIYSTPDLISSFAIPADTVGSFLLPSYAKKYGVVNIDTITYTINAGWLVKPPTVQFIGRNKIQLTQEFVWNEWIYGMYYIKSPPGDFPLVLTATQ